MCVVKEEKDKIVGVKEEKVASEMKGEEGDLIVSLKEVNAMKGKEGGQIVGMVEDVVEEESRELCGGCDRSGCGEGCGGPRRGCCGGLRGPRGSRECGGCGS